MKNQEKIDSPMLFGASLRRFWMKCQAEASTRAERMGLYVSTVAQPQRRSSPKAASEAPERKPWPMSWVIIAILLYMLFQVSYLALAPQKEIRGSIHYDRTQLKEQAQPPPPPNARGK